MEYKVSGTNLRTRRDEWIAAGVFAELEAGARSGCNRIIGLDLSFVAVDGSIHKAPCGGGGTGKSPVDRAKLGHKWSVTADANGIPIGVAIAGANRNDLRLLEATLGSIITNELLDHIELLGLNRCYDFPVIRERLAGYDLTEIEIQKRGTKASPGTPHRLYTLPALDRRSTQPLVFELRPAAQINRPQHGSSLRRYQPHQHRAHDRTTHRLL
jgi:hypothetical protein